MQIEVKTQDPWEARLTLNAEELHYLKIALERACYMDTPPDQQEATNRFAETLLAALQDELPESTD